MFCQYCGAEIAPEAVVCMKCGCPTNRYGSHNSNFVKQGLNFANHLNGKLDKFDRNVCSAFGSATAQQNANDAEQGTCSRQQPTYNDVPPAYNDVPPAYNDEQYSEQGYVQSTVSQQSVAVSPQNGIVTLILLLLLGQFGVHRFYIGRSGSAIAMLLLFVIGYLIFIARLLLEQWQQIEHIGTLIHVERPLSIVLFSIPLAAWLVWLIFDLIRLLCGKMTDDRGLKISL